jgi:hypothetical protein
MGGRFNFGPVARLSIYIALQSFSEIARTAGGRDHFESHHLRRIQNQTAAVGETESWYRILTSSVTRASVVI